MTTLLCIDPGPLQSGVVEFYPSNHLHPIGMAEVMDNDELLQNVIINHRQRFGNLVMEDIIFQGRKAGAETFNTCKWIGRFGERFGWSDTVLISRAKASGFLKAKGDTEVANAIKARFSREQIAGFNSHAWNALAVGLTYVGRK